MLVIAIAVLLRRRHAALKGTAFYPLLAAAGWVIALGFVAAAFGPEVFRSLRATEPRTHSAFLSGLVSDPAGLSTIARQTPPLSKPDGADVIEWTAWQGQLRARLAADIFELDFSEPTDRPKITEPRETDDAGLRRIEFGIVAPDGDMIPAVLLLPRDAGRVPAVLLIPGHVRDSESGLDQLVRDEGSYQRAAARALAMAGFATLTIELRGFGMRGPPSFPDHHVVAYNALLAGSFYKKVVFGDIKSAFDYLLTVPEVDPNRIGMSGASLGGELTVEYAALDPRVKAVSFHSHSARVGRSTGQGTVTEAPHYCHIIPGSNTIMDQEDPFLLLAPRPTQGIRGDEQPFNDPEFLQSLRRLWSAMGRSNALELKNAPGGHIYFVEPAIRFFRENL